MKQKTGIFIVSIIMGLGICFGQETGSIHTDVGSAMIFEGIELSKIHGGTFTMGSNAPEARINEIPHKATVGDFCIMKTEVTVWEFKKFVDATGYKTDAEKGTGGYGSLINNFRPGERKYTPGINWRCGVSGKHRPISQYNHPVIHVSFNDAAAFARWLSQKTGHTWRLPTEAEWEYAARGGKPFKYSGSNDINQVGWFRHNSGGGTHTVGQKQPNGYGLYDMTGNVWEMCSDWIDNHYDKGNPEKNPRAPSSRKARILRGGSWNHHPKFCRTAFRHHRHPNARNCINGFRLVMIP